MKYLALSILLALALVGQTKQKPTPSTTDPQIDHCGFGTHHDCKCAERYERIVQAVLDKCRRESTSDTAMQECAKHVPFYCNVIDRPTEWDTDAGSTLQWDPDAHEYKGESKMGPICTGACKMKDCTCNEGPTCHMGHGEDAHRR